MIVRKLYLLPNLVTTANIFCGFYSIVKTIQGDYITAAWLIVLAGVFDLLDGRIARMAKATSEFGIQYDSLSDLMSFGLAPAMLIYVWKLQPFGRFGVLASFLFLACGAMRLARFNASVGATPKNMFQGLPIPAAAGMVVAFIIFSLETGLPPREMLPGFTMALSLILSTLMVSSIPFFSFKEINWRARTSFGYLLIAVMTLILIMLRPEITLFWVGIAYIGGCLGFHAYKSLRGSTESKSSKSKNELFS